MIHSACRHIFLFILLLIGCNSVVFAQTEEIEQHKDRIEKLQQDIEFLDSQIKATRAKESKTLEELVLVREKISGRKKLLNELDLEIKAQTKSINLKQRQIITLERSLDTLEQHYIHLVQSAYKNRDSKVWFMYIIASGSIEQAYRRWAYLKNFSKLIGDQADKIRDTKELITSQRQEILKLKANNVNTKNIQQREYNQLTKEEQQAQQYAKSLSTKQQAYKKQLASKQSQAKALAREVEKMIKEAIRKEELLKQQANKRIAQQKAQNKTTIAKNAIAEHNIKLTGGFAANKGKLPFPVSKGVIIEKFGEHYHPTLKNVKLPFNNGINISAPKESKVMVVFDGDVKQVIAIPGYNQCVLVQHGNYFTFYCKLGSVAVKAGDKVKTGDVLGTLQVDNNTSVLHFELWNGTTKQNPELWLRK